MKTKKFFMTSLLVMGMIIAKAANGFPPELVLVSQPVLTYNANSVTVYYDIQNIGDYTYRGDLFIYLDPDDGRYYSREYMRICPGRIKRVAVTIPAYRPNPSWVYTVMPYYELGGELYSFTTFEYFEPVSFCWNGYRNEPWVVFRVGPRPRYYHRPLLRLQVAILWDTSTTCIRWILTTTPIITTTPTAVILPTTIRRTTFLLDTTPTPKPQWFAPVATPLAA